MLPPSTALLSTIQRQIKRFYSMTKALNNLLSEVFSILRMPTAFVVITLSITTFLLSASFIPGLEILLAVIDTLLLSRLYHPNMMDLDKKHNWDGMPLKLYGRHNLESYGHRLKEHKGEFGKEADWSDWSQEMQDYCKQDVIVTTKLWKHFHPYLIGSK